MTTHSFSYHHSLFCPDGQRASRDIKSEGVRGEMRLERVRHAVRLDMSVVIC